MVEDLISEIGINSQGGLFVKPATRAFPYIYREAMEVSWDPATAVLFGPKPLAWSYVDWFRQIRSAASEQGTQLVIGPETRWRDMPDELRVEIERAAKVR
jgi:Integron Cassette Protein Hfx_Cass5